MRILITGASGFLGSWVLRRLLDGGGHDIAIILRPTSPAWRIRGLLDRVTVIEADLTQPDSAAGPLATFAPETVLHLAWLGVGNRYRNDSDQVTNIGATASLLEMAARGGARTWIGLGSQAEYGPHNGPLDENAAPRPTSVYGAAKLCASLLAADYCRRYAMRFAWLRLFSCYGPQDDPSWLLPTLIRTLLAGQRPALTLGEQLWDYIYVTDAAEAICRVALAPDAAGVFNLGSGQPRTIRSIAEMVRDAIDPALPLGFGELPYRNDQVMHLEADIRRLRRATGWEPRVSLPEGVRRTIEWYRENQTPA
ncbi:MAG: NAD-dependent epimerase/dehydratase family protein [Bryobacteraceae bacterium]